MNNDMRISVNLVNHPKIKKLIRLLGYESFYSIISLWSFAAVNKPDGVLTGMDSIDIAIAANWDGDADVFFDTACRLGLIDCKDNSVTIHDWVDHNPYVVGSEDRSNKSRFNKMKSHYPELHKKLQEFGMTRITAKQYEEEVKHYLSTAQAPLKQHPSPVPVPSPTPSPKETNIGASPKKPKFDHRAVKPLEITDELWDEFIANRKHKKLQNTELALNTILKSFKQGIDAGYSYRQMIERYVSSNMQRFKVEWMDKEESPKNCDTCRYKVIEKVNCWKERTTCNSHQPI